jgi:two-component system, sensor histidine kinase and response regulator
MNRDPVARELLKVRPLAELGVIGAAGLILWLVADHVPIRPLILWASLLAVIQVGRFVLRRELVRRGAPADVAIRAFRISVLLLGLTLGGAAWALWVPLPFDHFVLVVLTYCMLAGGGVLAFSVDAASVYLYAVPLLAPVLPAIVARGLDDLHLATLGMVVLYAGVVLASYRRSHQTMLDLWDVSERAQTSETRFRQLTENMPEVFYVFAADLSAMLYVSPAYERVWGRSLEELQRNPRAFLDSIFPEDVGRLLAAVDRVRHGETIETEYRLRLADGTVRSIVNRSVPVRDAKGTVWRIAGIARDVTEQAAAREAERLARLEADRTTAAKMAFLANMSHEIRTPMSGILGVAELLRDTPLTPDQHRSLDVITSSGDALLAILNDILDLSKIEAGELALEIVPFDLPALVHGAARLLGARANERGIELVCDCGDGVPPRVRGDAGRLRQVLTNLLSNAVKFTPRGEVELLVTVAHRQGDEAVVQFAVRDTGIGIAAEHLTRIFAPFGQADSSTTRKYGGTGLGLSIARRLVRLMGSDISVESEPGRGSTFWFRVTLPVDTGHPGAHAAGRLEELQLVRTLVVDDNGTNRHVLGGLLRHAGADVEECGSVAEAVAALRAARISGESIRLLVSDVNMPDRDGFSLAEEVRADPSLADCRLMLLTSAGRPGDGERCRQLGVAAYLQKPVSRVELLESALAALNGTTAAGAPPPLVTRHTIAEARRPLRILLAEDNEVNQQVAAAMLRKRGHEVDIVGNGRQAVAAIRGGSYDLVLMDIQMPELGGLEATREIREFLGGRRLPIIALTADALSGERERCLAGGMDGYLAKPFKAFQLFAAVEGWHAESRPAPLAVDLAGFQAELRSAGAEDSLARILSRFRGDAPARLAAIEEATARADAVGMQRAAHAFKSSAGAIHAGGLAEQLQAMEAAAGAGDVAAASARMESIRGACAAVEECLAAAAVSQWHR